MTDKELTSRQAADLLGLTHQTLRRWADSGRIPHHRTPGGHRRFARSDLIALRAERAVGSGAGAPHDPVQAWARALDEAFAAAQAALGPTEGEPFDRARRELRAALEGARPAEGAQHAARGVARSGRKRPGRG
jgi:excisionase family DNA binding protein